jgi:hypothetical protein
LAIADQVISVIATMQRKSIQDRSRPGMKQF